MGDDQEAVTLGEIRRSLERIERWAETWQRDLETRVRRLERWMYALPLSLLIAIASTAASIVLALGRIG